MPAPGIRFFVLLLLAVSCAASAAELVSVIETRTLPREQLPAAANASHALRLSLYAFRGTRWLPADIVAAVLDALPLLAQCGVAVAGVELRLLETPLQLHFYSTPVSRD